MKKKLKITESQYKFLKLITEDEVNLSTFFEKMGEIEKKVNAAYKRLTFSSVAELIEGDGADLSVMRQKLEQFQNTSRRLGEMANRMIERIPSDEYQARGESYDAQIDDVRTRVDNKIFYLDEFVGKLENVVKKDEEGGRPVGHYFSDIKTIDI